ncbi:unnamed protein product [Brassicogethes aeneus]|uniref:E3 ubiquitin-protein ligase n=1 Tax=Brassicogethes aeneus TaxID=1431903 RepID=A0A9P0FBV1_BRAAE|nr:unnamed protein product [Brassicogethes aeneus]
MPKHLNSRSQELVSSLIRYFEAERDNNGPLLPLTAVREELVSNLKSEGHKFPPLRESDAMFAVDCAPEWAIGDSCQRCRVQLTLINRKYNCRHCGQVFCLDCSQSKIPLPKFGIEIDVRVCDGCYAQEPCSWVIRVVYPIVLTKELQERFKSLSSPRISKVKESNIEQSLICWAAVAALLRVGREVSNSLKTLTLYKNVTRNRFSTLPFYQVLQLLLLLPWWSLKRNWRAFPPLTMPQKPDAQKDKQEGLQLGLGFSQSEAEAKEKENIKIALHDANNAKCEMAIETMNRFTDDLLREKIFHCQICDELCTSDIFLVKGKGNVCGKCFEEKCGEEMKSRGELNTALILIISKLKLPCKFQPKGCDKRVAPKKYSKHIGRCEFKIKPCPMVNFKGCEWKGINLEVAEHIQEIHKEDVIKSDNNIFKVEASLTEPVSVKLLSDDCNNCILETLVEDNKFYYGVFKPPTKQS